MLFRSKLSELDQASYWQHLQVKPNELFGYRPLVGEFELTRTVRVPMSIVQNNPALGPGGAIQYVVGNFENRLQLLQKIELIERAGYEVPKNKFGR